MSCCFLCSHITVHHSLPFIPLTYLIPFSLSFLPPFLFFPSFLPIPSSLPITPSHNIAFHVRTYVGVEDVSMMTGEEVNAYDAFLVFLNGLIVGVHTKPTQLVEKGKYLVLWTSQLLRFTHFSHISRISSRFQSHLSWLSSYLYHYTRLHLCVASVTATEHDELFSNWYLLIHFVLHSFYLVRQLRRGGRIGEFVSVYLNPEQKAVYISSDGGRVCRPLLVLEQGEWVSEWAGEWGIVS